MARLSHCKHRRPSLSRVTEGKFKATYHRVRDIGKERYSVPFFLEPRSDAKFELPDSSIITYGPWMVQRLKRHKYQFAHIPDIFWNKTKTINLFIFEGVIATAYVDTIVLLVLSTLHLSPLPVWYIAISDQPNSIHVVLSITLST